MLLTTYDVMGTEVHYARPPPDRSRRRAEVKYPRPLSPLIRVGFWRVCLDEAQMLERSMTVVAGTADVRRPQSSAKAPV